jgi:hypothetical protein
MTSEEKYERSAPKWEERIPCVDESCIGTIGPDGTCRVCGTPYDGELPEASPGNTEEGVAVDGEVMEDLPIFEPPESGVDSGETSPADADDEGPWDADWENRQLCGDESCIGVIGPDGLCKECGKPLGKG